MVVMEAVDQEEIDLGFRLKRVTVTLAHGGNYVGGVERSDGQPWGAGVVIELLFPAANGLGETAWSATVTGARALWNVSAATVANVMSGGQRPVRLRYIGLDGTPLVWGKGVANVH